VPRRPATTATATATAARPLPPSPSVSSPNFVANLRATKSAPFDFTLIRCRCRAIDEANLPFTPDRDRRGFHFPRTVHGGSPFQGNHFPSLFGSARCPLACLLACLRALSFAVSLCALSSSRVHVLSVRLPLLSASTLSLVTQP